MKICVFAHTFPRFKTDTPAAFMDGFCEGLQKAGNDVFALIPYDQKINRKKKDQSYKVRVFKYIFPESLHLLGYSRTLHSDQKLRPEVYLLSPFYYFFGFFALLNLVRKEKIDLINAHWIMPGGFIAALVSLITGVPLVITVAGSDVYLATKNLLFKYIALFAAARAKYIVGGGSPHWTQDLVDLGADPEKTKNTIIYGVDLNRFYPAKKGVEDIRRKFGIKKSMLIVLAVGRLVYKKGMHVLIGAIPSVLKKYKNVHFIIVGDGDQRGELISLSKKLKIQDYLTMPGTIQRDELLSYYNLCDIYISTSVRDKEGNLDDQSIALVEAMACIKPTIATDLGGNRLVVKEGVNGYLFPMGKSKNLAEKISLLAKNTKLRARMSKEGYRLAKKEFSILGVGKSYTKLFKGILDK